MFISQTLADRAGKTFDQLEPGMRSVFSSHRIGAKEWDLVRTLAGDVEIGDAKTRIIDMSREIPADAIDAYLGGGATPAQIEIARDDIMSRIRSYFMDTANSAVIEANPRTRGKMKGTLKAGTPEGEAWLSFIQYKTFPIAQLTQRVRRDIIHRKGVWDGGGGWGPALAMNFVAMTTMGYMAMSMKDLAKGREPRSLEDKDTWAAAMLQGGAMGLYGDFLFGELKNRYGAGPLDAMMGPTYSKLNSVVGMFGLLKDGDPKAAQAIRFLYNNIPGANLFYTRLAADYFIYHRLMETVAPGSFERSRKAIKDNMDQELLFDNPGAF